MSGRPIAPGPIVPPTTAVSRTLLIQATQPLMLTTGLGFSANGASLVVAADYSAMRTLLGLGSVALLAVDTDGTLAANSDSRVASQKAVKTAIAAAVVGLLEDKGNQDCSANPNYPAANKGDVYTVSVAGKIGGASGVTVEVGDVFRALADNAGGTQASVGSSWAVVQANLVGALVSGGALGTPSSGTLSSCTGLPVAGISGLGTNVATLLATFNKANLDAAVSDDNVAYIGQANVFTANQTISNSAPVLQFIDTTAADTGFKIYSDAGVMRWSSATDAGSTLSELMTLDRSTGNLVVKYTSNVGSYSGGINSLVLGAKGNDYGSIGYGFAPDSSTYKYSANDYSSQIYFGSGAITFRTAASGTAGNTITYADAMTLTQAGNLLIGTSSGPSANGTKVLVLGDNGATDPTLGASTCGIYQKSGEIYHKDAAGNVTLTSPHAIDEAIAAGLVIPDSDMHPSIGKSYNVFTGHGTYTYRDQVVPFQIPPEEKQDWTESQLAAALVRERERFEYEVAKALHLERQTAEPFDQVKPSDYVPVDPPQWLQKRGVATVDRKRLDAQIKVRKQELTDAVKTSVDQILAEEAAEKQRREEAAGKNLVGERKERAR